MKGRHEKRTEKRRSIRRMHLEDKEKEDEYKEMLVKQRALPSIQ